jgi:hypothetical protein
MPSTTTARDSFVVKPNSATSDAHRILTKWLDSLPTDLKNWWQEDFKKSEYLKHILDSQPDTQLVFIMAAIEQVAWSREAEKANTEAYHAKQPPPYPNIIYSVRSISNVIWQTLGRRKLPWTLEILDASLANILDNGRFGLHSQLTRNYPFDLLLRVANEFRKERPLPLEICNSIKGIIELLNAPNHYSSADENRLRVALNELLTAPKATPLDPAEEWAKEAAEEISKVPAELRFPWESLIQHAAAATGTQPTKSWLAKAETALSNVGNDEFASRTARWFAAVSAPKPKDAMEYFGKSPMREMNADILKGLAWISGLTQSEQVAGAVGELAVKCFAKVSGYGAFNTKVGNACLHTLEHLPGLQPIAHLSRLRLKVKTRPGQAAVQAAINNAARSRNITADELEEISVPSYGLDEHGVAREEFGDCMVEMKLLASGKVELTWFKSGKPVKSVPAIVKSEFAEELAGLKRTIKELEGIAAAQRLRLEHLLVSERGIPFTTWRECYLDHPLVASLARRLVWTFVCGKRSSTGVWHQGRFVDANDCVLDWVGGENIVQFWHPITAKVADIEAWRRWLETNKVTQPFKQVHREVYLLTDAERATGNYSNRFAAHFIRQHQFAALARERGWQYHLQGMFDSQNTPTLRLPRWQIQAEFWVEPVNDDETSDAGTHLLLATDQVRFLDEKGALLPVTEIPPLAFSEVMRDVDLFVGVTSVGNDPAWNDGGPQGRYRDYWQNVSFGELNASARTRREVLERLVPRLKIAGICSFEEKFLVVQGSLRVYKIHLGSGNILMKPNDQYLCVVPNRNQSDDGKVFLPFEGDRTLSVIISKAFLLADDSKIKDSSILSQIKR